ncbi:MAG: 16S rRNA (adenine(1518)-N(6)/adenine(1519)-N(6))-dimethyltransferase RsmA [Candidatus Omnitrophica bacterium]|nr:16S rRNA (adenine(1518)-N(6)/adenine(1519)-N(6))-dimethyltransferase RsmA [Candidatus Omnitrophota bacterium]
MLTKRRLLDLSKHYNFRPSKRFGQNFLIDRNVRDKIIASIAPAAGEEILEIGPGFGELTMPLAERALRVVAVEKDPRLVDVLEKEVVHGIRNITVVRSDILKYQIPRSVDKVVGNLPYYITTPIIEKIFEMVPYPAAYIMVQKEYGERMAAGAGDREYSSLSCFVRLNAEIERLFTIKRGSFYPEPSVDSVFLKLTPRRSPPVSVKDRAMLVAVIRAGFGQRRKTLRASLVGQGLVRTAKEEAGRMLQELGISADARPEEIDLEGFARIADYIVAARLAVPLRQKGNNDDKRKIE